MKQRGMMVLACLVMSFFRPAASLSDDTEALAKRIQSAYDAIRDFKAHFVQESSIRKILLECVYRN